MRVLFVAAEFAPIVKVGGLGEASAGLVGALRSAGVDVDVVIPDYDGRPLQNEVREPLAVPAWAGPATARHGLVDDAGPITLIDVPGIGRPHPYVDSSTGESWPDNDRRFFAFAAAVAELVALDPPDVIHLNDWHTSAVTAFIDPTLPTVLTLHNVAHQGRMDRSWLRQLGSRAADFEHDGHVNALAGGIRLADAVVGSADVAPSTKTQLLESGDVNAGDWTGRNIHFGVREHAMAAICNGIAAHGGLRPYCATFFVFSDYLRPAIRMAALMKLPVIFVMTHDSIGVGEDGPTHQPIEHLASLRAMPGLRVIRPGDANEVAQAWRNAIGHDGPTVLVLSRQDMVVLDPDVVDVDAGAAVIADGDDVTIVATGTEVEVALAARDLLAEAGVSGRVVSMPSWELFRQLPVAQRHALVAADVPSLSVEAGATQGWREFVDHPIGLDHFGSSAPAPTLYREFGLTAGAVSTKALELIDDR